MPRTKIDSPRSSGRSASNCSSAALAPAMSPAATHARACCTRSAGTSSGGRDLDCLAHRRLVRGARRRRGASCARSTSRPGRSSIRRVLERQLGPRRTVAVGAHLQGPRGRLGEERDGLRRAAGAEQVMGDPLRRRVLRGEERRGVGVGTPQSLLRQPRPPAVGAPVRAGSGSVPARARARRPPGPRRAPPRRDRCARVPLSAASVKPSSITARAASSGSPNSSSRSSRCPTTSRSRADTVTSPEASTDAASSSAKNGLPAAERAMASRVPGGSGRPAARCATAASAPRSSGPSASSTAAPRPRSLDRTSAAASGSGSSPIAATTSMRSPAPLRAR